MHRPERHTHISFLGLLLPSLQELVLAEGLAYPLEFGWLDAHVAQFLGNLFLCWYKNTTHNENRTRKEKNISTKKYNQHRR